MWAATISKYLNTLCGNVDLRAILIPAIGMLEARLNKVDFQGIPQLEINYDLIEVLPAGWFFSISDRYEISCNPNF